MARHLKSRFGLAVLVFFFALSARAQAVHGVLKVVKGDVQITQASDGKTVAAKIGQKVFPKDTIVAGKDARAKIVMVDNNEINVSPDTKMVIQAYDYKPEEDKKNVLLNVMYGKVRNKVNQKYDGENKFQVKTPSAVAGVRGTDFMVGFTPPPSGSPVGTPGMSNVVTFSGKVAFGIPGPNGSIQNPVYVGAGQQTSASGNKPPGAPTSVPKDQLAKMDNETNAEKGGGSKSGDSRQPADDGKKEKDKDKGDKDKDSGDKDKGDKGSDKGDKDKGDKGDKDKGDKADKGDKGSDKADKGSDKGADKGDKPADRNDKGTGDKANNDKGGGDKGGNSSANNNSNSNSNGNNNGNSAGAGTSPAAGGPVAGSGPNGPPPPAGAGPMPASVGGPTLAPPPGMPNMPAMPGSTLVMGDLPSATTPIMPVLPPTFAPPPPPPAALPPPTNTFINNVISNQSRKITVVITGGP